MLRIRIAERFEAGKKEGQSIEKSIDSLVFLILSRRCIRGIIALLYLFRVLNNYSLNYYQFLPSVLGQSFGLGIPNWGLRSRKRRHLCNVLFTLSADVEQLHSLTLIILTCKR
jgi:hypothetical protein